MKLLASFLLLIIVFCSGVSARAEGGFMGSFRQNFATVIFSGLGGAALGLSTLSFYGEPQEHIGNIWTGMALGIIGGSVYVAQKAANSNYAQLFNVPINPTNPHQNRRVSPTIISCSFEF